MKLPEQATREDMIEAVKLLSQTRRGTNALHHLFEWLDQDGCGLDWVHQGAVFTLLSGAWGSFAGTVLDAMREQVSPPSDCKNAKATLGEVKALADLFTPAGKGGVF